MNSKKYILALISAIFLLIGCSKTIDNVCLSNVNAPITKVEGPTEGFVNQEVDLEVSFGTYNSCGNFSSFKENTQALTTEVTVVAKYEGCVCAQVAAVKKAHYKFTKTTAGTYQFNFSQVNGSFITHTVVVR